LPPSPLHDNVYVAVEVNPTRVCAPDIALPPVQPPDAVHVLACVLVHVSVDDPPLATAAGPAVNVTVGNGAGSTLIVTDFVVLPPAPEHINV
jgi:hypothetical protein